MGATVSRIWSGHASIPSQIIETKSGFVQGKTFILVDGCEVDAFLGIPFGKPPIGELRFKKPEPSEKWDGVLDCTQFGPRCPHEDNIFERFTMEAMLLVKSEDCLRLNVFAPTWHPDSGQKNGFAVMVWIHGGGYAVHSGAHYGDYNICQALCTKNVIVVSINYRLGFFGFLSTGDENAPGNFGLWDQTLALKWVKDNISAFGGDPENITIFGQSAGGASVDFLTLSPHSRDLFQKVVSMAGTACCDFALNSAEHVKEACLDYAIRLGFQPLDNASNFEQNKALVEFFRSIPPHKLELVLLGKPKYRTTRSEWLDLTPVIDGDFLPKPIEDLRKEVPKKQIMTGVTKCEGLLFVLLRPPRGSYEFEIDRLVTKTLTKRRVQNHKEAKKKILEMYYTGIDPTSRRQLVRMGIKAVSDAVMNIGVWEYADQMAQLDHTVYLYNFEYAVSDAVMNIGVWEYADQMAQLDHTVYLYNFEYVNPKGFGLLGIVLPFKEATHSSELPYIFNKGILANFYPNNDDLKTLEQMTTFWTNFAKYGNPNGKSSENELWKPLTKEDTLQYLRINLDKTEMCPKFQDVEKLLKALVPQALV
uniref:Carboxylic ester hydrolase n=2 Tax=Acrobeloides nanus TaxID=290746 RepID=A0A914DZG4_9BILA